VYNQLLVIREEPKLAMYTCKDIVQGEQLYWDYGIRERDLPWTYHKIVSLTEQKILSQLEIVSHLSPLLYYVILLLIMFIFITITMTNVIDSYHA